VDLASSPAEQERPFNGLPDELPSRRTMAQHIAEALRAAIGEGRLADGDVLNQVQLAAHFGTSRVPVREALRVLEAEGLVSAPAHRHAYVTGMTPARVVEIFELRALLEGHLLEKCGHSFGPGQIEDLWRRCDEMDATDDEVEWLARNQEFHERLFGSANAPMTKQLVSQLTQRYLGARDAERPVAKEEAGREHRRIVRALERGDVAGARRELARHVAHTKSKVLQRLEARANAARASRAGVE
jgi:DNA-binding GntR family transcriptional regulator